MKTFVVIPFKDEPELTRAVLHDLKKSGGYDCIFLIDNGSTEQNFRDIQESIQRDENIKLIINPKRGIYQMWNQGWKLAREMSNGESYNVCFLNNDIALPENAINVMKQVLRSHDSIGIVYPNYDKRVHEGWDGTYTTSSTRGTYQHGGMCGWTFMIKGEAHETAGVEYVDENLLWWYGDDFIESEFRSRGFSVERILGLPVDHINEKTANNGSNNWTHEQKGKDTQYWHSLKR